MKLSDSYARQKKYFRQAMTRANQNRWKKDVVYDIMGTLLLGGVILAMMLV